ncbi:MAG: hypothetical protein KKD13_03845 [Candidatus Margulisbacteria bacterium]|nr:hypothetical protein [Candidatus Margulisiibacteriota bacterium]
MILQWIAKLIGSSDEKKIDELLPIVEKINKLEPEFKNLSDEELRGKTT